MSAGCYRPLAKIANIPRKLKSYEALEHGMLFDCSVMFQVPAAQDAHRQGCPLNQYLMLFRRKSQPF